MRSPQRIRLAMPPRGPRLAPRQEAASNPAPDAALGGAGGTAPGAAPAQRGRPICRTAEPATTHARHAGRRRRADSSATAAADSASNCDGCLAADRRAAASTARRRTSCQPDRASQGRCPSSTMLSTRRPVRCCSRRRSTNEKGELWPGEYVATVLRLYVQQNAIVVPLAGGHDRTAGDVCLRRRYEIQYRAATPGGDPDAPATRWTVISSGLSDGEHVVTDGQSRLQNGSQVNVRARTNAAGGAAPASGPSRSRRGSADERLNGRDRPRHRP